MFHACIIVIYSMPVENRVWTSNSCRRDSVWLLASRIGTLLFGTFIRAAAVGVIFPCWNLLSYISRINDLWTTARSRMFPTRPRAGSIYKMPLKLALSGHFSHNTSQTLPNAVNTLSFSTHACHSIAWTTTEGDGRSSRNDGRQVTVRPERNQPMQHMHPILTMMLGVRWIIHTTEQRCGAAVTWLFHLNKTQTWGRGRRAFLFASPHVRALYNISPHNTHYIGSMVQPTYQFPRLWG